MDDLETLARDVGDALKNRNWMLATAESCTGGWVAQAVTAIAGSSAWLERGFVTYSNQAKQEMLGVQAATLAANGAVSQAVVREMAAGALRHSHAQISVAISGIAGPDGGTPDKPVGTVWLGWAWPDGDKQQRFCFAGDREQVRRQAVEIALQEVLRLAATSAS
jgi:nicotinamide-nucleotide amidase